MSCEIAGIKVQNGVIIDGFYTDNSTDFIVGENYFCGVGEEEGKLTATPSNLYIGRAVTAHKIKLDVKRFNNIFYTQISNTYFNATMDYVTNIWRLSAPSTRLDNILQLEKGDMINFLAPATSVDNQYISLSIENIVCPFLLTKHEGSSTETRPIAKDDLTQGTWVTAIYNPDEMIQDVEGAFRVDLATKGEFLKLTGGIVTGNVQLPSLSFPSNDENPENDKIIINRVSDNQNAIEIKTRGSEAGFVFDFTDKTYPTVYSTSEQIKINNRRISDVKYPEDTNDAANVKYVQDMVSSSTRNDIGKIEAFLLNIDSSGDEEAWNSGYCPMDGREINLREFISLFSSLDRVPYITMEEYDKMRLENLRGTVGFFGVDLVNLKAKAPYLAPGDTLLSSTHTTGSTAFYPGYYQQDQIERIIGRTDVLKAVNHYENSCYSFTNTTGTEFTYKDGLNTFNTPNGQTVPPASIYFDSSLVVRSGDRTFNSGICVAYRIFIGQKSSVVALSPIDIPFTFTRQLDSYTINFRSNTRLVTQDISPTVASEVLINNKLQTFYGNIDEKIDNSVLSSFPLISLRSTAAAVSNFKIKPQAVIELKETYLDTDLLNNTWYCFKSRAKNKIVKNISAKTPNNVVAYSRKLNTLAINGYIDIQPNGTEDDNLITISKNDDVGTPTSGMLWSTNWLELELTQVAATRTPLTPWYYTRFNPNNPIHINYKCRIYNDNQETSLSLYVNDAIIYVTPRGYVDIPQLAQQHILIERDTEDFFVDIAYEEIQDTDFFPMTLSPTDVYLIRRTTENFSIFRIFNQSDTDISFCYTGQEGTPIYISAQSTSEILIMNVKWTLNVRDASEYIGKISLIREE